MRRGLDLWIAGLLALALLPALAQTDEAPPAEQQQQEPLDLDVVERTERKLVQLDVSLRPKRKKKETAELPQLATDDFELVVAGKRLQIRYADRICRAIPGAAPAATPSQSTGTAPPDAQPRPAAPERPVFDPVSRGAYVFYLEHSHLTQLGQENALSMATDLIPKLVTGGARGMVVSSGRKLIQSDMTGDVDELLDTVRSIRKNTQQWTSMQYAQQEEDRIQEIMRASNDGDLGRAANMARRFQQEEQLLTANRLSRFSAVLGSMAELDPPKAVLYFADIVRQRAGHHYTEYAPTSQDTEDLLSVMEISSYTSASSFDRVTEEAGAQGVRLYTVQARGLDAGSLGIGVDGNARRGGGTLPRARIQESEQTMQSMALETGGASFRGGTEASTLKKVLETIQDDLSCFYLLSFYPEELALDQKLPVRVRFNQDSERYGELSSGYDVSTRGQIVVQSASRRKESALLAAHVSDTSMEADPGRGVVIPIAYAGGSYQALVQLAVTNPDLPASLQQGLAWDLGMSHEFREQIQHEVSGHVEVPNPGVPVVLEALWNFKPGTSKVVSVAHENRFNQIATAHREWEWPDPDGEPATISPIAVVQPVHGVFLRKDGEDEQTRTKGSLGVGQGTALLDRPTYLISLVCRSKRNRDELWIDRKLVGASPVDFELQHWTFDQDERCVQFRDLIREGQMSWGAFSYEVKVFEDAQRQGQPLAYRSRDFAVIDPDLPPEDHVADEDEPVRKVDPLALNSPGAG